MVLKLNCSFLLKYAQTTFENIVGRSVIGLSSQRSLSVSSNDFGRTEWSYTRPRDTGRSISVPKRLKDGKYYRNQAKGGRDHTGRILLRHKGGGAQRNWRIVDKVRVPLSEPGLEPITIKDRILQIGYDPFRTGDIALVAGNGSNQTKLILCPHETNVGDIITSSRGKPVSVARMIPGDAYPLEYLPLGTIVHSIEREVGKGGAYCCSAGTYATLQRKSETEAYLKESSKSRSELVVDKSCLAVIGRVSNPGQKFLPIGKAGRNRWLNKRPKGQTGKDRWHHRKKRV